MKLKIAGGCGEHGRNCFYIEGEEISFLFDCGLMAGEKDCYPHLTRNEIEKARFLFLSHSHQDHTGALPWLYENGFSGKIIATRETIEELPFELNAPVFLQDIAPEKKGNLSGLSIEWGRSGHAVGSVWYSLFLAGKTILYSGDYIEDTQLYICDNLRARRADLAILDCAYGRDKTPYNYATRLVEHTKELLDRYNLIVFPVPKYGRGVELAALFTNQNITASIKGDEHFENEMKKIGALPFRYKAEIPKSGKYSKTIFFISDPQLRSKSARALIDSLLDQGGRAIMTGTIEIGSYSQSLIEKGNMEYLRYPVHTNYGGFSSLLKQNDFAKAIAFHSEDFCYPKEIEF